MNREHRRLGSFLSEVLLPLTDVVKESIFLQNPVTPLSPSCEEPLVIEELEGVEVDHCRSRVGAWLDSGEIQLLTELPGVEPGLITSALRHAQY